MAVPASGSSTPRAQAEDRPGATGQRGAGPGAKSKGVGQASHWHFLGGAYEPISWRHLVSATAAILAAFDLCYPCHHGSGALPGPDIPALPSRLHLRQEEWHFLPAAHRGPAQRHLNKFFPADSLQRVPVLKDGDFVLSESVAILIYLSVKYQTADHWYPSDLQACVRIHEYLGWHGDCIRSIFGVSLWAQVLAPLIGIQVPEEKLKHNRADMDRALQRLEDKFLGDKAFLTGQQVTLADIMALEELMQVVALGCDLFEGRPRLAAWHQRVEAFLGADLCQEAHSVILSIQELAANKKLPDPPPEMRAKMLLRLSRIP